MLRPRYFVRTRMLSTRILFILAGILATGCATYATAKFPELGPPAVVHPDAPKVGLAPIADSRRDQGAGWVDTLPLYAEPGLSQYIGRKFRDQMVEEGFDPVDVAIPSNDKDPASYKTVLVTLQSSNFGNIGVAGGSTDIAVQVFAPGSHKIVFAQSYLGFERKNGTSGQVLADAADSAIKKAFSDPALLAVLR